MAAACTGSDPVEPARVNRALVSTYFYDGVALAPEFTPLPDGDPAEAVVVALARGPQRSDLASALPAGTEVIQSAESGTGFILEMNDGFWDGTADEIRRRAAQIVYSIAAIEDGQEVTLLDGVVPGDVPGPDGAPLVPPLTRDDFLDLRPWILVFQPVAGAQIANPAPVDALTRGGGAATVDVIEDGVVIGNGALGLVAYRPSGPTGIVRISVRAGGAKRFVDVPVRFSR